MVVFGLGILGGWGYYRWKHGAPDRTQSSAPITDQPASPEIDCFVANFDCSQLEPVFLEEEWYGYGVVGGASGKLLAPLTGSLTTGTVQFQPRLGGQRYLTMTMYQTNTPDTPSLQYILPQMLDIRPQPVTAGQALTNLPPAGDMPPFGRYQVIITAYDAQKNRVDPLVFLR